MPDHPNPATLEALLTEAEAALRALSAAPAGARGPHYAAIRRIEYEARGVLDALPGGPALDAALSMGRRIDRIAREAEPLARGL